MSEVVTGPEAAAVAGRRAEAVLTPETVVDLAGLLSGDDAMTLVPRAGGTQIELGNAPEGPFAVLDITRCLGGEVRHEPEDMTAVVPAATAIREVNAVLAAGGQRLALDPPLADDATIGGVLASGLGGPLRTRFGLPRDLVLGMTVMRADGQLVKAGGRVVKNVTGFDLMRLWCGSLGTLGIIAEATLRVTPAIETVDLVIPFDSLDEACAAATALSLADIRPEIADVIDDGNAVTHFVRVVASSSGAAARALGRAPAPDRDATSLYQLARDLGFRGEVLTARVAAPASRLPSAVASVSALRPSATLLRPLASFARFTWLDADLPPLRAVEPVVARLRDDLAPVGGSVIIDRMPASLRGGLDPWGPPPGSFFLMKRAREAWDPLRRVNRGRFIGGL